MEQLFLEAQQGLIDARREHFEAAEQLIEAKSKLEANKAEATLDNLFDGKNAEIREAQAVAHFADEIANIRDLERIERHAAFELETAKINMRTLEQILRVRELEK